MFCPSYDKRYLANQIDEYINTLSVDSKYYEVVIKELSREKSRLKNGDYERTQQYYDSLADEIGEASRRGFLKVSQNVRRKAIKEKGVDGDMIGELARDAYMDGGVADVFVLLTNDADHAPLAGRLVEDGKKVWVIGYASRPARALRRAVGDENVLNLLTEERDFDFDPVWLQKEDAHALGVLEDIRMQWLWWKSQGMV